MGEQKLKNITRPVHVFSCFPGETSLVTGPASNKLALTLPDRPSIAILPFTNMSGDPKQEFFADGIVEDIITALSRIRWLFVFARNSSFVYKGRAVDIRRVARESGVRYVLEGSDAPNGTRRPPACDLFRATCQSCTRGDSEARQGAARRESTVMLKSDFAIVAAALLQVQGGSAARLLL
jgi:hypothetical protein